MSLFAQGTFTYVHYAQLRFASRVMKALGGVGGGMGATDVRQNLSSSISISRTQHLSGRREREMRMHESRARVTEKLCAHRPADDYSSAPRAINGTIHSSTTIEQIVVLVAVMLGRGPPPPSPTPFAPFP
jgi:hypothetical protein